MKTESLAKAINKSPILKKILYEILKHHFLMMSCWIIITMVIFMTFFIFVLNIWVLSIPIAVSLPFVLLIILAYFLCGIYFLLSHSVINITKNFNSNVLAFLGKEEIFKIISFNNCYPLEFHCSNTESYLFFPTDYIKNGLFSVVSHDECMDKVNKIIERYVEKINKRKETELENIATWSFKK